MTPEEIREEAREFVRREEIPVEFTVECEEFYVSACPGLEFSADYAVFGYVTPDRSGDHITPNGPPGVGVSLLDPVSYDIRFDGAPLPEWLQEHLALEFSAEMDAAFLDAIGGWDKLNELAIDKVFG